MQKLKLTEKLLKKHRNTKMIRNNEYISWIKQLIAEMKTNKNVETGLKKLELAEKQLTVSEKTEPPPPPMKLRLAPKR